MLHDVHLPAETRDHAAEQWNARLGLALFALYAAVYGGFVALAGFWPKLMATELAGLNLALWWGFGLIVGAFVLALVYAALSRNPAAGNQA